MQLNHIKKFTNFLFLILLTLPVLQWRILHIPTPILDESRNKDPLPKRAELKSFFTTQPTYGNHFEDYFNDHFGFRDFLIMLQHQLDYSIFGWSKKIILGKDHTLFYRSVVETEQIRNERYPSSDFNKLENRIITLNEWAKKNQMQLVILPMPLKNSLMPTFLPEDEPHRPSPNRLELFNEFLDQHPGIAHLNVLEILKHADHHYPIFYQSDFHWTTYGANQVTPKLIDLLSALSPSHKAQWKQAVEYETRPFSGGGQAKTLGLLQQWEEIAPFAKSDLRPASEFYKSTGQNANDWKYENPSPKDAPFGNAVIFGDSFEDGMSRTGYQQYFKTIHKFYVNDFKIHFKEIPPNTQFLVLEFIEPVIGQMMNDSFWPESF